MIEEGGDDWKSGGEGADEGRPRCLNTFLGRGAWVEGPLFLDGLSAAPEMRMRERWSGYGAWGSKMWCEVTGGGVREY